MKDNSTIIGNIFYRIVDSKPEQFRLLRYKESNGTYSLINLQTNSVIKLTKETLKKDQYVLLKPDGYLTFNIVSMQGFNDQKTKDVMICLHTKDDIKSGIPYAICRQCIQDVFVDDTLAGGNIDPSLKPYTLGCSISRDTCPKNINFNTLLSCEKSEDFKISSIYLNDTLETIEKYIFPGIHIDKYNSILRNLHNMYKQTTFRGLSTTVYSLLKINHFMDDFDRGFGILEIPFEYIPGTKLNYDEYSTLCKILHCQLVDIWIVYYDKDIDLNDIQKKYAILKTPSNRLFVMAYNTK